MPKVKQKKLWIAIKQKREWKKKNRQNIVSHYILTHYPKLHTVHTVSFSEFFVHFLSEFLTWSFHYYWNFWYFDKKYMWWCPGIKKIYIVNSVKNPPWSRTEIINTYIVQYTPIHQNFILKYHPCHQINQSTKPPILDFNFFSHRCTQTLGFKCLSISRSRCVSKFKVAKLVIHRFNWESD